MRLDLNFSLGSSVLWICLICLKLILIALHCFYIIRTQHENELRFNRTGLYLKYAYHTNASPESTLLPWF